MKSAAIALLAAAVALTTCGCSSPENPTDEPKIMTLKRDVPFWNYTEARGFTISGTEDTIWQYDADKRLVAKEAHKYFADPVKLNDDAKTWRLTTDCYGWAAEDIGHHHNLRVIRIGFKELPAEAKEWTLTQDDVAGYLDFSGLMKN